MYLLNRFPLIEHILVYKVVLEVGYITLNLAIHVHNIIKQKITNTLFSKNDLIMYGVYICKYKGCFHNHIGMNLYNLTKATI